ncbi:MAG: hypothetical protein ABUS47_00055 [Steroidobacter sp.]
MQWNSDILSKFVAPSIADFTSADIPDLADQFPQAPYWVVNHFLNNEAAAVLIDLAKLADEYQDPHSLRE